MISIVVPVFNEEESLKSFFSELTSVTETIGTHEIVFIDDGSTDDSLQLLKQFAEKNKNVRVFSFRANQGKAEALTMGFQQARGEYVITLDADLQDKPTEIPKFIEKSKEGIDLVCGWRKDRRDKSQMVIISRIFNKVLGRLFGLKLHDYNCGFKLYTKEAAESLRLYGGMHRFIPLLVHQQGFIVDEIVVFHQPRQYGKSKYGFSKIKDLPDIFTMLFLAGYSRRPLHFFGSIGGVSMFLGFLILFYLTILRFLGESIGGRPLLLLGILLLLVGFQIFFTGFLAELIISVNQKSHVHFPLKYTSDNT